DPQPRFTSDAVRKLFRDVAKTIHPDLAPDEEGRDRRHALMIEANRAYAHGVDGTDPEAVRQRLVRRIAEAEDLLAACARELTALNSSPLGKLKAMVDQASAKGKDLIGEMVERLKRDIMVAQNRLDAIRS